VKKAKFLAIHSSRRPSLCRRTLGYCRSKREVEAEKLATAVRHKTETREIERVKDELLRRRRK
jgi:hypothetical protein